MVFRCVYLRSSHSQFLYKFAGILARSILSLRQWHRFLRCPTKGVLMFKFVLSIASLALAGDVSAQVEPTAGQWKTWVLPTAGSVLLLPPPDAAASAAEILQIKALVAKRDTAALEQIRFWDA